MQSLSTIREFSLLDCLYDWHDAGDMFAQATSPLWGSTSVQYLAVCRGAKYVLVGVSDEPCWWYVVPFRSFGDVFKHGGWAPPTCFAFESKVLLHLSSMPVLRRGEPEQRRRVFMPRPLECFVVVVYSDGSSDTNTGRCFAGGWVIPGTHISGYSSLYSFITGAEAGELLGIVGALHSAVVSPLASLYVFFVDSQNALDVVSGVKEPPSKDTSQAIQPPYIVVVSRSLFTFALLP